MRLHALLRHLRDFERNVCLLAAEDSDALGVDNPLRALLFDCVEHHHPLHLHNKKRGVLSERGVVCLNVELPRS
jgi:hypothetical protein